MEGSDRDLIQGTILEFSWRTEEIKLEPSVSTTGLRDEILT
jgi:hypothetical protein